MIETFSNFYYLENFSTESMKNHYDKYTKVQLKEIQSEVLNHKKNNKLLFPKVFNCIQEIIEFKAPKKIYTNCLICGADISRRPKGTKTCKTSCKRKLQKSQRGIKQ